MSFLVTLFEGWVVIMTGSFVLGSGYCAIKFIAAWVRDH